jgi:predicted nucleotidyltransferase
MVCAAFGGDQPLPSLLGNRYLELPETRTQEMPPSTPTLDALRGAARDVANAADYRLVVLFGSAARGDAAPSDVDVAVLARDVVDVIDCAARFSALLPGVRVDIVDLRRANPVLLMAVAREGISLFDASGSDFAEFSSLAMRRYADTKKYRDAVRDDLREFARERGSAGGKQS